MKLPHLLLAASLVALAEDPKTPPAASATPPASPAKPALSTAAARRNENVAVNRIDMDGLREASIRLGNNFTLVPQPPVEQSTYATEHGRPASELIALRPVNNAPGWHADLFWNHQNSVFNARTFFQVGAVKPSHQNNYGGRFTAQVKGLGWLTGTYSQRAINGMVNGNVLVPLASERVVKATDPAARAVITRFLAAYPNELPNRPDFDERALNTNAPQRINELDGSLRLDRKLSEKSKLFLSHSLNRQHVSAFQLVAGQNPDMDIHSHRARATWVFSPSAATDLSFGGGFNRITSALVSEPNAVGPRVRMGYQIEELGPDAQFPIHRAQNSYRWGMVGSHRIGGGRHTITFGGDGTRSQLNGIETNNSRGVWWFTSTQERPAIQNLLFGIPNQYEVTVGELARGFRNWGANFFAADQWRVNSRLQLYFGLRYNLETAPVEVNGIDQVGYRCDCNNFSPRFAIALQLPHKWTLRTSYTVSFASIPPVTYQQVRYNPPTVFYIQIQKPNFPDPLRGFNLTDPNLRTSPTWMSPDLVSSYVHQYNLQLERKIGSANFRVGYLGSRSFKLMDIHIDNRGEIVPGIPTTLETVDLRRRDSRYYEVKTVLNAGAAYFDAGQTSIELPRWKSLSGGVTYTFSKSLDTGSDFTGTAANRDQARGRAQSQYDSLKDRKGLSNFDSTHALIIYQNWDLPRVRSRHGVLNWIADGWQWNSSALLKTGTPLTLYIGSDAPGFGNVDGSPSDRPNILDPSILGMTIGHPDTAPIILSRNKFSYMRAGETRGSLGRGAFRKGGIANWNGALAKRWKLGGAAERSVQFRAESVNLGNHPQFDEPNRNLNATVFGKITNTLNDGRVFQLVLRFTL